MSEVLAPSDVVEGLARMFTALIAHADELNALDAAIGDGDMGVTMRLGSQAVLDALPDLQEADIATVLTRSGMAFNRVASSTIGAFIATAGMRAGKEARGIAEVDLPALARLVAAAEQGIRERGKANRGDKTLLDALIPAVEALQEAAAAGAGLHEAGRQSLKAAEIGRDATTALQSQVGRAGWIGERTVGHADPGATAVVIMLRALVEG